MNQKIKEIKLNYFRNKIRSNQIDDLKMAVKITKGILKGDWELKDIEQILQEYSDIEFRRFSGKESFKKLCSQCKEEVYLLPISIKKSKANIYGYKSKWICGNCLYEEYSEKDIYQISDDLNIEQKDLLRFKREVLLKFRIFDLKNSY